MCHNSISICCDCVDSCFLISTFIVPFLTYLIIQKLRPRIDIISFIKDEDCIKVKVVNNSRFFDSNNLRIEICAFNEELGYTYHFAPDHTDFLILPNKGFFVKKDNSKTFVSRKPSESAMLVLLEEDNELTETEGFETLVSKLSEVGYKLRVRCHAYHSFSGLGKSFEKIL